MTFFFFFFLSSTRFSPIGIPVVILQVSLLSTINYSLMYYFFTHCLHSSLRWIHYLPFPSNQLQNSSIPAQLILRFWRTQKCNVNAIICDCQTYWSHSSSVVLNSHHFLVSTWSNHIQHHLLFIFFIWLIYTIPT